MRGGAHANKAAQHADASWVTCAGVSTATATGRRAAGGSFRQRRLLRAHRERPCRCRAAEHRDERATFRWREYSVNGLRDQRNCAVTSAQRHRPRRPFLIETNVCRILEPKLTDDGFNVLNRGRVPSSGRQGDFHQQFSAVAVEVGVWPW